MRLFLAFIIEQVKLNGLDEESHSELLPRCFLFQPQVLALLFLGRIFK